MKLDPNTGAIIWRKLIPGNGFGPTPFVNEVNPLRGTNDVIVSTIQSNGKAQICRVDSSSGNQVWYFDGDYLGYPIRPNRQSNFEIRYFGATSPDIVCSITGGTIGLDYSGNLNWNTTLTPANTIPVLIVGPGAFWTTHNSGLTKLVAKYDATSGTLVDSVAFVLTPQVFAVDSLSGYSVSETTSLTFIYDSALFNVITTSATAPMHIDRWNTGGISHTSGSALLRLYDSSLNILWTVTSVLGSTTFSTFDTDNDTTGGYFSISPVSANNVNVVKISDGYGSFIWGQDCDFKPGTNLKSMTCCLADDGFLYVGGGE